MANSDLMPFEFSVLEKKWPVSETCSGPAYTLLMLENNPHRQMWLGHRPGKGNKEHFAMIADEDENNNWSRSFPKQFLDEGRIIIISNKLLPLISGTEQDPNVPLKLNKVGLCESVSSTNCSVLEE